ncbi:MAG: 50S ribosomal protein L28 [bacterium]
MSKVCDLCGKKPLVGNSVSHSNRKTKKRQMPNLHPTRRVIQGTSLKLKVCTKCHRRWLTG